MMRERLAELIADARNEYYDYSDELHEKGMSVPESSEEYIADYLIANGVVVMPCDVGTEIKGEIVHEIDYYKSLTASGEIIITKKVYACDKDDIRKIIFCSHPMTWEDAERALKGETK